MVALDDALHEQEKHDANKCRLVELKFFGGLTAEVTGQTRGAGVAVAGVRPARFCG
ncbi:MAG: hypothetical protein SGI92_12735 [Bryobacteraceae bacterium]|nr:hypothetical protein [Bryobacteraceae bacterium]